MQGIGQEVISAGGESFENNHGAISFTLGEAVAETFSAPEYVLTQGFQQGKISVSTFAQNPNLDLTISAYPNVIRDLIKRVEKLER